MAGGGNTPGILRLEDLVARDEGIEPDVRTRRDHSGGADVRRRGCGGRAAAAASRPKSRTPSASPDAASVATLESLGSARREHGDVDETRACGSESDDIAAEASFQDYVAGKYRFLFTDSGLSPEASAALRATLLERERIAVAINTARQSSDPSAKETIPRQQAELEALDRKVGTLLPPGDLAAFDVLKDSDIEQFQLDDFAGGASNVAPLSDADKKAILYTKLVYRQRFRQVLADSRFMRDDLTRANASRHSPK